MSVTTEITRLQQAKAAIKTAVQIKGVTIPSSEKIDAYPEYISQITGSELEEKDVNFYDYDGTLLYSYTKAEFLALSAMPGNPSHVGLISQGWNWSLADAKEYVTEYGGQIIGQNYITDDGKTRLYVTIEEICKNAFLTFTQSVAYGVSVDWGDGSSLETVKGTGVVRASHDYENTGNYVITLIPTAGTLSLGGASEAYGLYGNSANNDYGFLQKEQLKKVEIGNILGFTAGAFTRSMSLECITIPTGITSIPNNVFNYCRRLKAVVLPTGLATIGDSSFYACTNIEICSLPKSLTSISAQAFMYDRNCLKCVYFPVGVTLSGNYVFEYCWNLKKIVIPGTVSLPRATFCYDYELEKVIAPDVTSLGQDCFYQCNFMEFGSDTIDISKITSMNASAIFQNCVKLNDCEINSAVTTIANSLFAACNGLKKITIPSGVTNIGSSSFSTCSCLEDLKVLATTPPTVANTNFLGSTPSYQRIIVPEESLADYMVATNWTGYKARLCGLVNGQPQEVEHLYSDGNQTINTHIKNSEIGKVSIELKYVSAPTGTTVVCDGNCRISTPVNNMNIGLRGNTWIVRCSNGTNTSDYAQLGTFDTDWHTITMDIVNQTGQLDDNSPVSVGMNKTSYDMSPFYFFGLCSGGSSITNRAAGYRRNVKIWNKAGEIIFDAIPVRVGTTGYMYDKITGCVLPNIGTGDFTVGPDVQSGGWFE